MRGYTGYLQKANSTKGSRAENYDAGQKRGGVIVTIRNEGKGNSNDAENHLADSHHN